MKSQAYNVYLNGKLIDTVFYDKSFTAEEVRDSLISHDGYNPHIRVVRSKR